MHVIHTTCCMRASSCTQPVLFLPTASAEIDLTVSNVAGDNETCARFHQQQPTGLLQHCSLVLVACCADYSDSECRCSFCNWSRSYERMMPFCTIYTGYLFGSRSFSAKWAKLNGATMYI